MPGQNIKNPTQSNLNIVPYFKNSWSVANAQMAEEIAFENGRIFNTEGFVTLTLGQVILHTVEHHSSTSRYTPNFIEIKGTFCERTQARTDIWDRLYYVDSVKESRLVASYDLRPGRSI